MQARLRGLLAALLALTVAVACDAGSSSTADDPGSTGQSLEQAEVVRVVDGDTIIVLLDGREERLRYIGIDAPESVTPEQPVECFGPEAGEANERLVGGNTVYLETDIEGRDRFNRLLRYVYVEEPDGSLTMVNLRLVASGFAEAGFYPPNERYSDDLFDAERQAAAEGLGLWGAC